MPKRRGGKLSSRKIGGKTYRWKGWGYSKSRANEIARGLRGLGNSVRVIKTKKSKNYTQVWDIFARKKKR